MKDLFKEKKNELIIYPLVTKKIIYPFDNYEINAWKALGGGCAIDKIIPKKNMLLLLEVTNRASNVM